MQSSAAALSISPLNLPRYSLSGMPMALTTVRQTEPLGTRAPGAFHSETGACSSPVFFLHRHQLHARDGEPHYPTSRIELS